MLLGAKRIAFNIGKAWDRFWFEKYDPLPLDIMRIFLGSLISIWFLFLIPNWNHYYELNGMTLGYEVRGGWSVFEWTDNFIPTFVFWYIGFLSALLLTIGWHTKLWVVILWVLISSMTNRNRMVVNGEDLVFRMILFYLMFSPVGAKLRFFKSKFFYNTKKFVSIWSVRALQLNICAIYIFSTYSKLTKDSAWIHGEALYWTMMNTTWSRGFFPELFYLDLISQIGTYSSLAIEGLFPVLVWVRSTKIPIVLSITIFHIAVAVTISNVTFFTLAMVASFWCFLSAKDVHKLIKIFRNFHKIKSFQ